MADEKKLPAKDIPNGGKEVLYCDVDRIINEGMAGGTVEVRGDYTNIEEARDLHEEERPYNMK